MVIMMVILVVVLLGDGGDGVIGEDGRRSSRGCWVVRLVEELGGEGGEFGG